MCLLVVTLLTGLPLAGAQPGQVFEPTLNEQVVFVPLAVAGSTGQEVLLLTATTYHPQGKGPFPLVVLSHGSPANAAARARMGRYRVLDRIREFVARGYAVIVPMRRGYGDTGGDWAERFGPCASADYYQAGRESALDLLATLEFARKLPYVRPDRIVLVGQSAGGFASIATASFGPQGVVAVVNFAGGRGGRGGRYDGEPCSPDAMAHAIGRFAATIKVPVLWHYAENDRWFGPHHVRAWFEAFERAGARGKLVMQPPFGEDGHRIFASPAGRRIWTAEFDRFIHEIGIQH